MLQVVKSLEEKLFDREDLSISENYLWNEIHTSLKTALNTSNCEPEFFPYSGDKPTVCCRVIVAGETAGFCAYKSLYGSTNMTDWSGIPFQCGDGVASIMHSLITGTLCIASNISTTGGESGKIKDSISIYGSIDTSTADGSLVHNLLGKKGLQDLASLFPMIKGTSRIFFGDGTSTSTSVEESEYSPSLTPGVASNKDEGTIYVDLRNLHCLSRGSYSLCTQYVSLRHISAQKHRELTFCSVVMPG